MTDSAASTDFALDSRLAGDTLLLGDWPLCRVLLMDDSRYPWLVLVPRRRGAVELHDLAAADRLVLIEEVASAGRALAPKADKVNTGALGNIVAQLHVHVLARRRGDPAWPGPVWGHSPRVPYTAAARGALVVELQRALGLTALA